MSNGPHGKPDDEDIFASDISDDALEAAATPQSGAAMSLLGAPTVNILVMCCGNN